MLRICLPGTHSLLGREIRANKRFKIHDLSSVSSVQSLSRVQLFVTPWTQGGSTPGHPESQLLECTQTHVHQVGDAISSSVIPFSCPQSFPASGSFQMSQLFASGGQSIGVSTSTSVLPLNTPGLISFRVRVAFNNPLWLRIKGNKREMTYSRPFQRFVGRRKLELASKSYSLSTTPSKEF